MGKLLLIDGTNIAYRWIKDPAKMLENFPKTVISLARSFGCEHILVSFDNKGSSFRKEIYPDYKGNRGTNLTDDEKAHRKFFYETVSQVPALLSSHDIPCVALERIETDDVIAYICGLVHDLVDEINIVSSDKDLYQLLIWDNVRIYSITKQEWMDYEIFTTQYGIEPISWIDVKALQGDTGDNIPGLPLVGEKRALAYIHDYGPSYEDILRKLPLAKKKLGKIDQTILQGREIVTRNRRLMDLVTHTEEIIPEDYREVIDMFLEQEGIILGEDDESE